MLDEGLDDNSDDRLDYKLGDCLTHLGVVPHMKDDLTAREVL